MRVGAERDTLNMVNMLNGSDNRQLTTDRWLFIGASSLTVPLRVFSALQNGTICDGKPLKQHYLNRPTIDEKCSVCGTALVVGHNGLGRGQGTEPGDLGLDVAEFPFDQILAGKERIVRHLE